MTYMNEEEPNQAVRIAKLRAKLEKLGGTVTGPLESMPAEDSQTYLKYYADEKARVKWGHDWPGEKIPKHEEPPFDRDRFLPQSALA